MSCIACDSEGRFRCTIGSISVCLCSKHLDRGGRYDSVVPAMEC